MNRDAPPAEQIAWAAGLFEGEGCITLSGQRFHLALNNTNEGVVYAFRRVLDIGNVYGPYQQKGNRKPFWVWGRG